MFNTKKCILFFFHRLFLQHFFKVLFDRQLHKINLILLLLISDRKNLTKMNQK